MSEREELERWVKHVDVLLVIAAALLILAISGCASADPRSIDAMAESRGWTKDGHANNTVVFRTGDPSAPCQKPADGCEKHLSTFSIITTRQHWCAEPAGLIAHELAHACGWRHP
jgi:hypothetical protein